MVAAQGARPAQRGRKGDGGFTLVEVLVSVSILTLATGLVGGGIFQSQFVQGLWRADVVATKEWRNAQSWFSGDALRTQTVDLIDGDVPSSSVTFTWTFNDAVLRTATYALSGSDLIRDYDGVQTSVARRVVSASFTRNGSLVVMDLEIFAGGSNTERSSLQIHMRNVN